MWMSEDQNINIIIVEFLTCMVSIFLTQMFEIARLISNYKMNQIFYLNNFKISIKIYMLELAFQNI